MADLQTTDEFLVNRTDTTYTQEQGTLMANLETTDYLLINREDATYKITGEDLINSIIDELEVTVVIAPNPPLIKEDATAIPLVTGGKKPDGGYVFSYQWHYADDLLGTNKVDIPGQTASTYAVLESDIDKFIGCTCTTTDAIGTTASGTGYAGPVSAVEIAPVIDEVILTEIPNGNRYTDKEFPYTTVMTIDGTPDPTYALKARLSGTTFNFGVQSDTITKVEGAGENVYTTDTIATVGDASNDSQTWSDGLSASPSFAGAKVDAFNGTYVEDAQGQNLFDGASSSGSGGSLTLTINVSDTGPMEILGYPNNFQFNTSQQTVTTDQGFSSSQTFGWIKIADDASTVSTITIQNNSNNAAGLQAIRVGGDLLIDPGQTVSDGNIKLSFPTNKDFDKFEEGEVLEGFDVTVTGPPNPSALLDGDLSTISLSNAATLTSANPLSGRIEIYTSGSIGGNLYKVETDDAGTFYTDPDIEDEWTTLYTATSLTTLTISRVRADDFSPYLDQRIAAYRVNGVVVTDGVPAVSIIDIDADATPPTITVDGGSWLGADGTGDVSDGRYEPSQEWSDNGTGTDHDAVLFPKSAAFNGVLALGSGNMYSPGDSTGTTFTFPNLTGTKFEVYVEYSLADGLVVNGQVVSGTLGYTGLLNITSAVTSTTGTLDSIKVMRATNPVNLAGVIVDDKILVDSSVPGGAGATNISKTSAYNTKLTVASDKDLAVITGDIYMTDGTPKQDGSGELEPASYTPVTNTIETVDLLDTGTTYSGQGPQGDGDTSAGREVQNNYLCLLGGAGYTSTAYNNLSATSYIKFDTPIVLGKPSTITIEANGNAGGWVTLNPATYDNNAIPQTAGYTNFANMIGEYWSTITFPEQVSVIEGFRWNGVNAGWTNQISNVLVDGVPINPERSTLTFASPNPDLQYFREGDEVGLGDIYSEPPFFNNNGYSEMVDSDANKKIFNGTPASVDGVYSLPTGPNTSGDGSYEHFDLNFFNEFSSATTVKIEYMSSGSESFTTYGALFLNGQNISPDTLTDGGAHSIEVDVSGVGLKTIEWRTWEGNIGNYCYLGSIYVDGTLIQDGTRGSTKVISTGYLDGTNSNTMVVDGGAWSDGTTTQLNTIEVTGYSSLYYIEVDGVPLDDLAYVATITNSAGGAYESPSKPLTNIFDDDLTNFAQEVNQAGTKWDASSYDITFESLKVQVYLHPGQKLLINGVDMEAPEETVGIFGIDGGGDTFVTGPTNTAEGTIASIDGTEVDLSASSGRWIADNKAGTAFSFVPADPIVDTKNEAYGVLQIINDKAQVTGIQASDPGFVNVTAKDYSIKFPSVFATGNAPDADLPMGTAISAIVKAENSAGASIKESNILLPQLPNPEGSAGVITDVEGGGTDVYTTDTIVNVDATTTPFDGSNTAWVLGGEMQTVENYPNAYGAFQETENNYTYFYRGPYAGPNPDAEVGDFVYIDIPTIPEGSNIEVAWQGAAGNYACTLFELLDRSGASVLQTYWNNPSNSTTAANRVSVGKTTDTAVRLSMKTVATGENPNNPTNTPRFLGAFAGIWINGKKLTQGLVTSEIVLTFPEGATNFDKFEAGDVVQDPNVKIIEINADEDSTPPVPTITVSGGSWYGSDTTGTIGGDTNITKTEVYDNKLTVASPTNLDTFVANDSLVMVDDTGAVASYVPVTNTIASVTENVYRVGYPQPENLGTNNSESPLIPVGQCDIGNVEFRQFHTDDLWNEGSTGSLPGWQQYLIIDQGVPRVPFIQFNQNMTGASYSIFVSDTGLANSWEFDTLMEPINIESIYATKSKRYFVIVRNTNGDAVGARNQTDIPMMSVAPIYFITPEVDATVLTFEDTIADNPDLRYFRAGDVVQSAFNNTYEWSNHFTSPAPFTRPKELAFDGDNTTAADTTQGWTLDTSGYTFGTGTHTIEIVTGGAVTITVNSTPLTNPGGSGVVTWTDTYTGEINTIYTGSEGASLRYIAIDGKVLADSTANIDGVKVISTGYPNSNTMVVDGGDWMNHAPYVDSVTTSDAVLTGYEATKIFDGVVTTGCTLDAAGTISTITIEFPEQGLAYSSSVKVERIHGPGATGGVTCYANDSLSGTVIPLTSGGSQTTVLTGSGFVKKLVFTNDILNGGVPQSNAAVSNIWIDDVLLVDTGESFVTGPAKSGTGTFVSTNGTDLVSVSDSNYEWIANDNRLSENFYIKKLFTALNANDPAHVAMQQAVTAAFAAFPQNVSTRRTSIASSLYRLLAGETLTAEETAALTSTVTTAVNAAEPFAYDGYYPLYYTADAANAASSVGDHHTHDMDGQTFYMPDGGTIYHGTYIEPEETSGY